MNRSRSIAQPFKPELESLEGRVLPAAGISVGALLPVLTQPIQQEVSQLNSDVQTMTQDFNKLKSDISASGTTGTSGSTTYSQTIAQDYAKLAQDLGTIQGLNTAIQQQATADLYFTFYLAYTGNLNFSSQQDVLSFFNAYTSLTTSITQATQDLSTATSIAAESPGSGYETLDAFLGMNSSSSSSSSGSSSSSSM